MKIILFSFLFVATVLLADGLSAQSNDFKVGVQAGLIGQFFAYQSKGDTLSINSASALRPHRNAQGIGMNLKLSIAKKSVGIQYWPTVRYGVTHPKFIVVRAGEIPPKEGYGLIVDHHVSLTKKFANVVSVYAGVSFISAGNEVRDRALYLMAGSWPNRYIKDHIDLHFRGLHVGVNAPITSFFEKLPNSFDRILLGANILYAESGEIDYYLSSRVLFPSISMLYKIR